MKKKITSLVNLVKDLGKNLLAEDEKKALKSLDKIGHSTMKQLDSTNSYAFVQAIGLGECMRHIKPSEYRIEKYSKAFNAYRNLIEGYKETGMLIGKTKDKGAKEIILEVRSGLYMACQHAADNLNTKEGEAVE
ncbi:hypothetical protein ACFLZZ_00230 [Nanoarchaeota archaeon]